MFGWLKSLFGSEPERIVPPPLPSKVKKAEKLVGKKLAKKATTKKEAPKVEASKEKVVKEKIAKATAKKKEAVKSAVDPAPKKKDGRPKKNVVVEPAQTEQSSPNS
jgi:uncharacterized ferritin-like protein (DUF455 family)